MTMDNKKMSEWISLCCFILSPEDSEHMRISLWTDIPRKHFLEYCKTAFWLIIPVLLSLGISQLS
ncbi:MAG: hypothetical protein AB7S75_13565 [Desulfococcaceae bacterium]